MPLSDHLLDEPRPSAVWAALPPETRALAARAVFDRSWEDDALRERLTQAVAEAIRFRPAMVQKLPIDKRAAYAARALRPDDSLASDLLIALHLVHRRPLLRSFLDQLEIPHRDGLIDEHHDPAPPDPARLRAAVARLLSEHPPEEVEVYLLSLAAMDAEVWGGAIEILRGRAGGITPAR